MIILGIHDGHNCGCSIFKDGVNLCTLSEEKVTRNKNEYGFPKYSINEALNYLNLKKKDIDFVAVSTKYLPPKYFYVKRKRKNVKKSLKFPVNPIDSYKFWVYPSMRGACRASEARSSK